MNDFPDKLKIGKCHPFNGGNFYVSRENLGGGAVEYTRTDLCLTAEQADARAGALLAEAVRRIEANPQPCSPAHPDTWTEDQLSHYESGQSDAAVSFVSAILAIAPAATAALARVVRQAREDALEEAAHWIESVPQSLPNRQEYAGHIRRLVQRDEVQG